MENPESLAVNSTAQAHSETNPDGLIIRQKTPENLEFPFHTLANFLTPTDQFFVRNHFAIPSLTAQAWQLQVEGAVDRPLTLTLADLTQMPTRTLVTTLECAGNGRTFLTPQPPGVAWTLGAVGNAEWTGIPLATILALAGVQPSAVDVVLEGADQGELKEDPKPPGEVHYARSLPLAQAQQPTVLLAYAMNGTALTPAHGFPLRALVPGWYGMASVKWLTRIIVTKAAFHGYFQTTDYSYWAQQHGLPPQMVPITTMGVKAQIARPTMHEVVPANRAYRIYGAAWAGDSPISKVDVSTNSGTTWQAARLLDTGAKMTWRLWEFIWQTPNKAGPHTLMARATDEMGHTQPLAHQPAHGRYMINHVLPIPVEVR